MYPDRHVRILCYGDSNTWGYAPHDGSRFPETVRWTGRLQRLLGPAYQIIEEGLNGRTTVFDYAERFGKNGRDYLRPCLDAHYPLDAMILCLGTNDAKVEFGKSPEEIAAGLETLIQTAQGKGIDRPSPGLRLLVAAPPLVRERFLGGYDKLVGGEAKTAALPALYRALAARYGASFVDLSEEVEPSALDGLHLDADAHARVAEVLHGAVLQALAVAR